MSECFCGCGQRARVGTRSINRIGSIMHGDVATVLRLRDGGMRSPRGEEFVDAGLGLCEVLAYAVHAGVRPPHRDEADARDLMEFGRAHFSVDAVVEAVGRSGMSTAQAAQALRDGEFDPYAQVSRLPIRPAPAPAQPATYRSRELVRS
jgi:hypothetical protein